MLKDFSPEAYLYLSCLKIPSFIEELNPKNSNQISILSVPGWEESQAWYTFKKHFSSKT